MKAPGVTCDEMDVVVVPFPFTDGPGTKRRPALVVSSKDFHELHGHAIFAMITSVSDAWPGDVPLRDWQHTGLTVPCRVRFKVFTLDRSLIRHRVGTLSTTDAQAVRAKIAAFLAPR